MPAWQPCWDFHTTSIIISYSQAPITRRIYIANFAILNRDILILPFTLARKIAKFHRLQCMHEDRGYRYTFQRARVASSPEVPKVTWWKIATFLGYHLHWLTSLETSRHFRKIALRLGIFLAMFRECLWVVATCTEMSRFF